MARRIIVSAAIVVALAGVLLTSFWNGTSLPPPLTISPVTEHVDKVVLPPGVGKVTATAYVTLSPHCPVSNSCVPVLNRLHKEYSSRGVQFVGVVPGAAASAAEAESFASKFRIRFSVIHDAGHKLCRHLQVTHTPQVVLLDENSRRIYSGRIDDRYTRIAGSSRNARDETLKRAIDLLIDGQTSSVPATEPIGCLIEESPTAESSGIPSNAPVTFCKDVAPVVFRNCSRCHRPGEAAPFSLLSFDDTVRHAKQIRHVVTEKLMPPWKPVKGYGSFQHESRLTEPEISLFQRWVDAGCVYGTEADLPSTPQFATGWQLGEPDAELIMSEAFDIPADGPDLYQHFIIPTGIAKNRLIRAFEFRPGAPEVVHHAFVYFDTTGRGRKLDDETPEPGYNRIGTPGFIVSGSLGGFYERPLLVKWTELNFLEMN